MMSRTFSTNSGSEESVKVSLRCGCRPKARQMRWTVEAHSRSPRPSGAATRGWRRAASPPVTGEWSRRSPHRGSCAARPDGARPGARRGGAGKRRRHFATVLASAPTSTQIALFSSPAEAARTIRARRASPCPVFCARARDTSSRRSGSVRSMPMAGLPSRRLSNHPRDRRNFAIRTLENRE